MYHVTWVFSTILTYVRFFCIIYKEVRDVPKHLQWGGVGRCRFQSLLREL